MKEVPLTTILSNLESDEPKFALLLGAGASHSSGIPPKTEICEDLRKRVFLSGTGRKQEELNYVGLEEASDWCKRQTWYDQQNEYGLLLRRLYPTEADRIDYLTRWMEGKYPSRGLLDLAIAIKNNVFNVVLTTNFDRLVEDALTLVQARHPVVVQDAASIRGVRLLDKQPKIIKLHGDFLYGPANLEDEMDKYKINMREKLDRVLTEYGLLVVGYGGNDRSVMSILNEIALKPEGFRFGLYWLHRDGDTFSPFLQSLLQFEKCHHSQIESADWFFQQITAQCKLKDEELTARTVPRPPHPVESIQGVGSMQSQRQALPTNAGNVILNGSDVTDLAVGVRIIYAIDGVTPTGNVYRSKDGGVSWIKATSPAAVALTRISVAPDNDNVIAVTDGTSVFTSSDAGSTWSALPSLGTNIWAGAAIMDISVAPARSGTLLGREFVIAVADPVAGQTLRGDVLIIGGEAAWASCGPVGFTGDRDYVAVAVSPNFVRDRSVVALGAAAKAGESGGNGVVVQVINLASHTIISTAHLFASTSTTTDFGSAAASIVRASIALPSDFDATTASGRRAYVGFASGTAQGDNDVYRVDDAVSVKLGAVATQGIYSVAYSGTISKGILFEARIDTAEVKYSTDTTKKSPNWTTTRKLLPTSTTRNVIALARDFVTSKRAYVATSGSGSAFSISQDGGVTFNQKSLIDIEAGAANNIGRITSGPALAPDNKTAFIASLGGGNISLWASQMPSKSDSWMRVLIVPCGLASNGGMVVMSPDYATTLTLYLCDLATGGTIYRSTDGGATWNNRLLPTVGTRLIAGGMQFQNANVGYIADTVGNIYKTTNGAWTWSGAVQLSVGAIKSIVIGEADQLLVGGSGMIANSLDGGVTFTRIPLDVGVQYRICKDTNFATNSLLFLADGGIGSPAVAATGAVYTFKLDVDSKPTNLLAPNAGVSISSLAVRSGVLYVFYAHGQLVDRTATPYAIPGTITWTTMSTGLGDDYGQASGTVVEHNIVYLRSGGAILRYEDQIAKSASPNPRGRSPR